MLHTPFKFVIITLHYIVSACNPCRTRYCFTNSVCLSSAATVSKRMDIVTLFWCSGRGLILVFLAPPPLQNSKRNVFSDGVQISRIASQTLIFLCDNNIDIDCYRQPRHLIGLCRPDDVAINIDYCRSVSTLPSLQLAAVWWNVDWVLYRTSGIIAQQHDKRKIYA